MWRLVVTVTLVAAIVAPGAASVDVSDSALVATQSQMPSTDGRFVVWLGHSGPLSLIGTVIWAKDGDGAPFIVADSDGVKRSPSVDGGVVVWIENRYDPDCPLCYASIRGKNLVTGREFVVNDSATPSNASAPSISGDDVVWSSGVAIWTRNIATMAEPVKIADLSDRSCYDYYPPVVSNQRVVWMECYEPDVRDPVAYPNYRIWMIRIGEAQPELLVDEPGNPIGFDLAGDSFVYSGRYGIVGIDLLTDERSVIDDEGRRPTTDGRYVIWEDWIYEGGEYIDRVDLLGYDRSTDAALPIIRNARVNSEPQARGGLLTWQRGERDYYDDGTPLDVYAVAIRDILPSAPRPQPDVTIPEVVYYPETGHYLGWQFRMYWEGNGGLPVFGYPLTEEYEERSLDTGQFYPVQFFERQRFERHPENAGTPYEVLLGRLGYEDALARGLLGSEPFQPILRDIVRGDCVWFGETRQMACTDFISYWRTHGLDLGDDGTSYRESLALFGYPISRPYIDPATGLLTQYFERAVFELHPNNSDPYRVLLRRLGAEALDARGW